MVMSFACLGQGIPPQLYYYFRASDIAAVDITFYVIITRFGLSIDVKTEHRTHNLTVLNGCATYHAKDAG